MTNTPSAIDTNSAVEKLTNMPPVVNANLIAENPVRQSLRWGHPRKQPAAVISVMLQSNQSNSELFISSTSFLESRRREINGLLNNGVFKIISILEVPQGTKIFNSRFIDQIKNSGTAMAFKKLRLIV